MTQALNLANFANNLNTSGATSNAGLQNSSVTVTAGTGMSGGGAVSLGSSVTLTNAGVTSVTAGTGISVSASTGSVTISTSGGGGVTSVATGNGLSGGTITSTGTLTIAAPSAGSVGSYAFVGSTTNTDFNFGSNYSVGTGSNQFQALSGSLGTVGGPQFYAGRANNLSGTWKYLGADVSGAYAVAIAVRVS